MTASARHRASLGQTSSLPCFLWLAVSLSTPACADHCEGGGGIKLNLPATALAGSSLEITARYPEATGGCGQVLGPTNNLELFVTAGGGLVPDRVSDGTPFQWQLGPAPIRQELSVHRADTGAEIKRAAIVAALDAPVAASPFADVNAWMSAEGIEGSTEDLAFSATGDAVVMGIPGGLIEVNAQGKVSRRPTSGDPLVGPLGVAFDRQGRLWVADSKGAALRRVATDGVVTTALTADDDGTDLQAPNYVAIDREDRVLLTDPCIGRLLRLDPKSGEVDARQDFDLLTEGGPNGVALDSEGRWIYLLTENTALLCADATIKPDLQAPIAGLFRIELKDGGFGPHETIAAGIGLFGDGLAFDLEGNLYVVGDRVENFALKETFIAVLRKGESQLVPFVSGSGFVIANVAFGRGGFGATTLYAALLTVPPFTKTTTRGLMKVEVGVGGLPLL